MNKNYYLNFLFKSVSLTLLAVALISVLHPDIRSGLRTLIMKSDRTILSTAAGDVLHDGLKSKIIKIRENNELFLEVYGYESKKSKDLSLIGRIALPLTKDAYFTFRGVATNLALDDVDGDSKLEILVPGFDNHLSAQMNVYKFDEIQKVFFRVPSSQMLLTKDAALRN